jgi:hypothetical protein
MTPQEHATLARRRLAQIHAAPVDVAPVETPAQHARNALTLLSLIEQQAPAFWYFTPELGRAARRTGAAIVLLETPAHYPPVASAAAQLRGAVEALCEAPVAWDLVPDVRAACTRLVRAVMQLEGGVR